MAHGFGRMDVEATKRHGLTVTNTVYGDVTIAQFAFGLLLDICHNIGANDHYYKYEKWLPENKGRRGLAVSPQIELYERSDVIDIHCPLTDETRGMIDKEAFEKMKDGVIIINTARGAIIDEEELVKALNSGKVYAAGLDVVAGEPLQEPCEIMKCENTRITEHIAWMPVESRIRSIRIACKNFLNWKAGNPTSVVNV